MSIEEENLSEALRALSHHDRRVFVHACGGGARSAGELSELSHLSLPSVSEHLKVLRKSGLLILDRQGRNWMYQTDTELLAEVAAAVQRLGMADGA
ncbi:MAG: helix-turn-helix transcriptional regulator [Actinobacteria bacterium]|nr:helix-turn-helix transcriptional regulator [Actinomycetota bacterium]